MFRLAYFREYIIIYYLLHYAATAKENCARLQSQDLFTRGQAGYYTVPLLYLNILYKSHIPLTQQSPFLKKTTQYVRT